jgi:hypothetical protein
MRDIRKGCIGPDYKDSMCYVVGQSVLGNTHFVHLIKYNEDTGGILIYIEKGEVVILWKEFNGTMPISIEYNINF